MRPSPEEIAAVEAAVREAGESVGAPGPYKIEAVYAQADDPGVKLAVFSDAGGVRRHTAPFKIASKSE